ncbi:hypothetical protein [Eubacterium ramulus]
MKDFFRNLSTTIQNLDNAQCITIMFIAGALAIVMMNNHTDSDSTDLAIDDSTDSNEDTNQ